MITFAELEGAELAAWRETIAARTIDRRVAAGLPQATVTTEVEQSLQKLSEANGDGPPPARGVFDDGMRVGTAWLGSFRGHSFLHDLDVPPELTEAAFDALLAHVRAGGESTLDVPLLTGDAPLAAALSKRDATLAATHMLLGLSKEPGAAPRVRMQPFTTQDLTDYTAHSIDGYANEIFQAGGFASLEAARASSAEQYDELLPNGLDTPGQHFWAAYDGARRVGLLWIFVDGAWSFIYDIEMEADVRGLGYGTEVLALGAIAARNLGATHLGLNVFGHNPGARKLYERVGFAITRQFFRVDC